MKVLSWQRCVYWFLRRFKLFRDLDDRLLFLEAARSLGLPHAKGTVARVEAELHHTLCCAVPLGIRVGVLPTRRVCWLGPGEVRAQLYEGGGEAEL